MDKTHPVFSAAPKFSVHIWDRWIWVWHALSFLFVAIASLIAISEQEATWPWRMAVIALASLLCLWYWMMVIRHPERRGQTRPNLIYMIGAIPLAMGLTALHPVFFMVAFSLWAHAARLLPVRWTIPLVLVYAALLTAQWIVELQLSFLSALAVIGIIAVSTLAWSFMVLWIDSIIDQSERRQALIDELGQTRRGLAEAERQAGILAERQRLAREIHDTLAQSFISIVLHLEAAEQALPPEQTTAHRHLKQARQTARHSLAEARRMIWATRPELLEQRASLPDTIDHVVTRWRQEYCIPATATITGTPRPLPPDFEVTLLRAAQEALANIHKHAQADQVTVTLSYMEDLVTLDVQDDGCGFDPLSTGLRRRGSVEGGFGLQAMRERIEQLNGSLALESAPGQGTTLVVQIPFGGGRP